jgi:cytochrome c oxidase cbb3-type subunit 1
LNLVAYGWAFNAIFGIALWIMYRLSRIKMQHSWVAILGGCLWNFGVIAGIGGIMGGYMTSVEWLEMPKEVAPLLAGAFLLIGTWAVVGFARREPGHVYVSQWYIIAAMFWLPMLYCTAQMMILWFPARGTVQAITNWWFGHNVLGLWLTPVGAAAMYYFIPKVLGKPIHSYYLSIVGFWSLALFYNWAGVHHLIGGPIPVWAQSAGIVASIMMVVPIIVTAINFHKTTYGKENWRIVWNSPTLRFVVFGAFNYTLSSFAGSAMALREVNRVTHFTNFTVGHAHHGMYAFLTMVLFGSIYFIMPRLLRREWPSAALIKVHFWLVAGGVFGYVLFMSIHGILQGMAMNNPSVPFLEISKASHVWNGLRTACGTAMTLGHVAFAMNFFWLLLGTSASREKTGPTLFAQPVTSQGGAQ